MVDEKTYEYDIHLTLKTNSMLEPRQIIGEALEDYKENYGISKLDEFIISAKEV